jgi:hypothetical protein
MDDADFEAALAAAFQTPVEGVQRRDMTETILQRVSGNHWARACVLAGAGLIGAAIAGSALAITQLARPIGAWAMEALYDLRFPASHADPTPFIIVGLVLTGLTVARNAIRDL